ncbi:MAG: tyrosine-protein phosphatase [Acidobacteria bacterium]|nr:tyrosine-protein phosphatase [Acidobacteriota bacterium]
MSGRRAILLLFSFFVFPAGSSAGVRLYAQAATTKSDEFAQKLPRPGLPNLGKVSEMLYRGAQPEKQGIEELKKLGIEIVVNFRNERKEIEKEKTLVETQGLRYVSIPWSASDEPDDGQVAEFLKLLHDNRNTKVFAHCHYGADRTGVMIAAFRMAMQGWDPEKSLAEMREFHYHEFWQKHLRKYVRNFPGEMKSNPRLQMILQKN